ncbi:MAG: hypothetical protein ACUZ8A_06715 [Candidatus Bathyanammoxibius sp.]
MIDLKLGSCDPLETRQEAFDLAGHLASRENGQWSEIRVIQGRVLQLQPTARIGKDES